MAEMWEET
jgi:hypothetical protein